MSKSNDDKLFPNTKSEYGEKYSEHLIEQYRIYVENTDKLLDRRDKANTFFLSANSFLLSALGILTQFNFLILNVYWIVIASVAGITFAMTWMLVVRSFRQLSSGKFEVINAIEKKLPAAPFTKEWEFLEYGQNWKKYTKLTKIEIIVPIIFAGLYIALSILILVINNKSN
ncbi:hypothetical protein [Nitrosarchaeum sp. AC2]|uniref:RipA family octameric membrane protein n=1 Tax=Nitrosarchaeum sp. AC2 TaxID=2259673 RepID=UPI0015CBAEBA|nr:hypothetical protein [Nitrosarchaeum sp. AC2]QLH10268.1 hypothetical protein DSQ20_01165 [Nitrosarchaeum sp. AC2]